MFWGVVFGILVRFAAGQTVVTARFDIHSHLRMPFYRLPLGVNGLDSFTTNSVLECAVRIQDLRGDTAQYCKNTQNCTIYGASNLREVMTNAVTDVDCNLLVLADAPAGNEWTLIFKAVARAGGNILDLWNSSQPLNENNAEARKLNSTLHQHYKSSSLGVWETLGVTRAKVALYDANGVEVVQLVFNASGTDKLSWFARDRLLSSNYDDILSADTNAYGYHFAIVGATETRTFYISKTWNDCPDDHGWLLVASNSWCGYETYAEYPMFLYAQGTSSTLFAQGTHGEAEVFAVFVSDD